MIGFQFEDKKESASKSDAAGIIASVARFYARGLIPGGNPRGAKPRGVEQILSCFEFLMLYLFCKILIILKSHNTLVQFPLGGFLIRTGGALEKAMRLAREHCKPMTRILPTL